MPSTVAYLYSSLVAFDLTNTRVWGLLPSAAMGPALTEVVVSGLAGAGLCSTELLLNAEVSATATPLNSTALAAAFLPPAGLSQAALACILGYAVFLASCPGAGTMDDSACAWDTAALPYLPLAPYVPVGMLGSGPGGALGTAGASVTELRYVASGLSISYW